jgi:hypothetical protein
VPPRNGRNGLERWRGEVSAHLTDISARIVELGERFEKALTQHADEDHETFGKVEERLIAVEKSHSRLAGKIAVVAVLGGALAAAGAEAVIRHLFG